MLILNRGQKSGAKISARVSLAKDDNKDEKNRKGKSDGISSLKHISMPFVTASFTKSDKKGSVNKNGFTI